MGKILPLHQRMTPLPEYQAVGLLLKLGRVTPLELELLDEHLENDRKLTPHLDNLLQLILFAQLAAPTPSLH